MKITFSQKVMMIFSFLEKEYCFKLSISEDSERWPEGEGFVSYLSPTTYVSIDGETGGVAAVLARVKDHDSKSLSREGYTHILGAQMIYEYTSLTNEEKKIVLSHNPSDEKKAGIILDQKILIRRDANISNLEDVEKQLINEAHNFRKYADKFLRGEYSQWFEIYEYKVERIKADYARRWGKELVNLEIKMGSDGKQYFSGQKTFEQDYLEKIREEYKGK
jgi:hypothetical protein